MDRSRTMPRLSFVLTAVLTLAGAVLRTVCMLTDFDTKVGYFNEGFLPTLSNVLYFAMVISAIVCAFLIPKGTLPTALHTRLRFPAAFLWGLSLAAFTVVSLILCFPFRTNEVMLVPTLLGLLASTYFFVSGKKGGRYPDWLSLMGFVPVLWCVAAVGETYTDQFTAMNSPIKVALQMGFIGLMLILISELRFRLGKPLPRTAVALTGMGCFFALNGALPVLAGTGAGVLDNILHMLYAVVLLCGGLYGLFTLFQYTCLPTPPADGETAEPDGDPQADTPEVPTAE